VILLLVILNDTHPDISTSLVIEVVLLILHDYLLYLVEGLELEYFLFLIFISFYLLLLRQWWWIFDQDLERFGNCEDLSNPVIPTKVQIYAFLQGKASQEIY
jgi:hypothetical protein